MYYQKEINQCRRKIALDNLDIWYNLAEIQILSDSEDNKDGRILQLKKLHIKKIEEINKEMMKSE